MLDLYCSIYPPARTKFISIAQKPIAEMWQQWIFETPNASLFPIPFIGLMDPTGSNNQGVYGGLVIHLSFTIPSGALTAINHLGIFNRFSTY
jgi:hypothetical protein